MNKVKSAKASMNVFLAYEISSNVRDFASDKRDLLVSIPTVFGLLTICVLMINLFFFRGSWDEQLVYLMSYTALTSLATLYGTVLLQWVAQLVINKIK